MPTIDELLVGMMERIGEIERRVANMVRHGPVTDVDPKKQLVRVRLNPEAQAGQKDEPFKSAWVPYAQLAGDLKFHDPPAVGQNMTLLSPGGDPSQSVALSLTWADKYPSPGDKQDPHILTYGDIKITYQKDPSQLIIAVGKAIFKIEKDKAIKLEATDLIEHKATAGDVKLDASKNVAAAAGGNVVTSSNGGTLLEKGGPVGEPFTVAPAGK